MHPELCSSPVSLVPVPILFPSCPYLCPIPILIPPPTHLIISSHISCHLTSYLISSPPLPYPHPPPHSDLISHPSSHPHPFFTPIPLLNANPLLIHQDWSPPLAERGSQILPWGYHSPPSEQQISPRPTVPIPTSLPSSPWPLRASSRAGMRDMPSVSPSPRKTLWGN